MSTFTTTTYNTEGLIAGMFITDQKKMAADTYYRGMPLEYDTDNDRLKALDTGNIAGIWLEDERTLTANQYGTVIIWGELNERGIVDSSGDEYTITEDIRQAWRALGFFLKR